MQWVPWLQTGVELREIEPGLYSVIEDEAQPHHYDRISVLYDLLIGNSLYNRILWGNGAADYTDFCRQVLATAGEGPYLDAGCGTLVFSAEVYADSSVPMVLMDRSLGMLRKGKQRLERLCGEVPENIVLLQGDIFQLPFHDGVFQAVASYGLLHLFADVEALVQELQRVGSEHATLGLSSLVRERGIGRWYYDLLQRSGEIACRRSARQLVEELQGCGRVTESTLKGNMASVLLQPR